MHRRRPYYDDDERPRKRRKMQSEVTEIEDRLESLITRVGEKSTSSLESNLEGLASVLEGDLQTYKMRIMRILSECAVNMPEKCSIYTTLIGLINVKNYNFGGEFVELMVRNLKESLKSCQWEAARYTLRFISDMVNCHVVSIPSLISLLNNMAEVTTEEGPQVRKDWYTFAILTTLPWIGRELYEQKERDLEQLLTKLERHIHTRNKIHQPALQVWRVDTPHPQEEYLDCLWSQIKKLKTDGWQEKHILRPYLSFDQVLCEALQHTLPSIYPPPHHPGCSYPMPHAVFRLFDYTDCPDGPVLPGAHAIERFLIEEQLRHIIMLHINERKQCAAHLLAFPQKHLVPLEYMIVEIIISEFFYLPNMRYLEIALGSLLIELCKLQPSTMPQVLAQSTEMLWERLDYMNVSCFDRFSSWFSYHLSQFQFRWSWDDWSSCLNLPHLHPKKKFIMEVLEKCLRLSYHQRIIDFVPDSFKELVPEKPEPCYRYNVDGAEALPEYALSQKILEKIRSKCSADELIIALRQPVEGDENMVSGEEKASMFLHILLHLGNKTFSHSFSAIAKFHSVLKMLGGTEDSQIAFLTGLYDLWKFHSQKIVVLIDKLLKSQIVECAAVLTWLFSKEMANDFTKHYVWEIVHLTIRKMNRHVMKLEQELSDAKEKLKEGGQSSDSEGDGDRPSEESIEKMEEKVEAAQANQKNLFLIIFQRFIMLLSEHLVRADTDGRDFRTHWWSWVLGRLQEVFMLHHEQVYRYKDTLETLLFTQDLDAHILSVFQQFTSLRA